METVEPLAGGNLNFVLRIAILPCENAELHPILINGGAVASGTAITHHLASIGGNVTKNMVVLEMRPQISNGCMDLIAMMRKAATFLGVDGEVGKGRGRNWVEVVVGNGGYFYFHDPTGTASLGPAIGGWMTMEYAALDAEMQKG